MLLVFYSYLSPESSMTHERGVTMEEIGHAETSVVVGK